MPPFAERALGRLGKRLPQPETDLGSRRDPVKPPQVARQRQPVVRVPRGNSLGRLELAQVVERPGLAQAQLVVPAWFEPGQPGAVEPEKPGQRLRVALGGVALGGGNRAFPAAENIVADKDKASPVAERDNPAVESDNPLAGANLAGEHNREDRHIPAAGHTLAATASPEHLPEAQPLVSAPV